MTVVHGEVQRVDRGIEFPEGHDPAELIRSHNHGAFRDPDPSGSRNAP